MTTSASDIRQAFLDYFGRNGHRVVESSPLVPRNDPTLMFTNAGMVQFKNVFTGQEKRPYSRAATSQKCVRAGGKHNDLDNVGYTARHHTFFEMLGNFSFGDYFKEEAIPLAWNLITKEYGLPKDKLWVTVYHDDDQAFNLWKKVAGLPDERIVRIATSDNFWAMGDTGPCGPCSEIFYDHGDKVWGGPPGSPEADGDRYIEIWNLVFMQYEQVTKEERINLPKPSIDTGMGLERITAVMQGKHDNYDIDLMRGLIEASAEFSKAAADGEHKVSHRVIADHLRSSCFLIADGVLPSNEGRGYVLRRIMRRAMRHAQLMGCKEPLMHRLVPSLVSAMGRAYPELGRAEALIAETLKLEETRFKQTLERGLKLLDEATTGMGKGDMLPGETAFRLYDTFGFPLDLTQDALRNRGINVNLDGFQAAMQAQREEARKAWAGSGEAATEKVWFEIKEEKGATEFLGYDTESAEGRIEAIIVGGQRVETAETGAQVALLLNQTPFYAESGGQVGDTGRINTATGAEIEIADTQKKLGALHAHIGVVKKGKIAMGDLAQLIVDHARRTRVRSNHSATHLLHAALRRKLGDHVTQKGSLVSAERLRFDISHPKAVSTDEIAAVEAEVNDIVRQNDAVATRLMTPDEAIAAGAMALFGEKYGDEVRVLSMGKLPDGVDYSVELCGGTHVKRTGDIALFKIVGEGAVASGVRRIEALTGEAARDYFLEAEHTLRSAADALKAQPREVPQRLTALLDEKRKLERELSDLRKQLATGGGSGGPQVQEINGIKLAARKLDGVPAKDLRGMADAIKKEIGSGVVALISAVDGKVSAVVGVTPDLAGRADAASFIKLITPLIGGQGGGGRQDFAQGGGADPAGADAALQALADALAKI
ncbi:alanine--tRNA ligase [Ferrovibrio sp.]|uniref:alanine--tRNA ligase n=1 Tax=Ferrovibrio sp. TaxID=1917215 RepID=UPI0025C2813D|nr:alanine--tRNA ligase [Ferrovibrio sp.]MBX3455536.1 alanine--tRNA ligase [Ferrovibrio sp.]